jgi:hypothetical protein
MQACGFCIAKPGKQDCGAGLRRGLVVTFPEFTPLRTISGTAINSTAANVIGKAVAYSFPDHPEEKPDNSKGDAGSMDSPFDFVWKMKQQQTALEENTEGTSTISSVLATNNQWKNYKKGTSTRQLFIPSLGLLHGFPTNGNNESPWNADSNTTNTMSDDNYWNWKYTFEAGTDCVGFAQRAASYKDGRHYEWVTLPKGIMDAEKADYNDVQDLYNGTHYRAQVRAAQTRINSWDIINKNKEVTTTSTEIHRKQLLHVVPGDIWVKYKYPVAEQDTLVSATPPWRKSAAHIAVVAYVPPDASELSVSELMNQIILVEAEYNNKIQSVIKVLSIGDYNNSNVTASKQIYDNFVLTPATLSGDKLNCKSWAVRRLKCKE